MTTDIRKLFALSRAAVAERQDKMTGRAVEIPPMTPTQDYATESRFSDDLPVLHHRQATLDLTSK